MKSTKLLAGVLSAALACPAMADTFEITGATAFRRATIESIHALYLASGQPFRFAHNRSTEADFVNADTITFEGTITDLGPTTVRCAFNGSIEGLRAIADSPASDPRFYKSSILTDTAVVGGANQENVSNSTANTETAQAEIAFSDTDKAISPYASYPMSGGSVGVAVFGLVVNEGSAITNVTTQQYNSLLTNGYMPLSLFTGNASDTSLVFCTGRNDGSGTRSSYLAEMGYGVSNIVQQFLVVGSDGNEITAIQAVPAGGTNDTNPVTSGVQLDPSTDIANFDAIPSTGSFDQVTQLATSASTVWGQDVPGNGGAFSGSVLRGHLALAGTSVTVFDADGFDLFGAPQTGISLVSWVSLNDATTARTNGAKIVAFNGVSLAVNANSSGTTGTGSTFNLMTAADKDKCYRGNYTAWNFQQMYRRTTASANTVTLYNKIAAAIPTNLGSAGLRSSDMKVGRPSDGGVINPL
jgi:hypothetical protein